jgi:PAS domain S-box-containing protein
MQQKPKSSNKRAFLYVVLGLLIAVVLVGILSILYLVYQKQPITLGNLVNLHTSILLFWYVDIFALYSVIIWGVVGFLKDRADNSRRYSDWLAQNQQQQVFQAQQGQSQSDKKHQEEIASLKAQLVSEGTKFQDLEVIIRRGRQHWQATFDAVNDLIILTDESGNVIRCNRVTAEVFKLGFSQIIGQSINELFPNDSVNLIRMVPGEKREMKLIDQELWYEIAKNHLLVDGRQEGWVYIFRDVTVQKQAFRDQQRLTQYYELLVNNSPIAIVTLDLENRIIDCNPAFEGLFLYSKQEAKGAKIDDLICPATLVLESRGITDIVLNGGKVKTITQRQRKDGSLLDVEVFGIPIILGEKQVGWLGLYHDATDLVRYQKPTQAKPEQVSEKAVEPLVATAKTVVEEKPAAEEKITKASQFPEERKALIPVGKIEGIGPVHAKKLASAGIKSTQDLLDQGKTRQGREDLVEKTGISATLILKWVNMADLMHLPGIGEEYSELLEKTGVDTVKELRRRNPKNLLDALVQTNAVHRLVRRLPDLPEVEGWVKKAKEADSTITY